MIDKATVAKIFDTTEIVEVIQEFVTIKKRGVNYLGLCPFHNEKTPSFTVSPAKGIFKCFGCGKGGNAVNFLMEHEHISYHEALKYLAKKYNIEVIEKELTAEDIQQKNRRESLMIITSYAQEYFTENLNNNEEGKAVGFSYLLERGYKDDVIEKFQLGYSLEKKDAFTKAALNKGYNIEYMVETGLTIKKENNSYDRFKGRVIFPVHSLSGKVIGFGGRTMKSDPKQAKYINSPESDIYHKSSTLYGIYYSKNAIIKNDKCFLVEGYTDVLSLHQAGIENVVASSGTALTPDQVRLIKRFTSNISIIYDGDPAGVKASLRGIDLILEEGLNVKVILLPENEDPDSFSKKQSLTELNKFITTSEKDFIAFKTQLLLDEAIDDPVKKARLISDIVQSIAVIPDSIIRSVYVKECSVLMNIDEKILYSELYKFRRKKAEEKYRRTESNEDIRLRSTPVPSFINEIFSEPQEREIIRYLLKYGKENLYPVKENENEEFISVGEYIVNEILDDDLEFKNLLFKQIFQEYHQQLNKGILFEEKYFLNHADEKISKIAVDLVTSKYILSPVHRKKGAFIATEEMKLRSLIPKSIIAYKTKILEFAQKEIEKEIKTAQDNNFSQEDVRNLLKKSKVISNAINSISRESGWVTLK